MRKTIRELRQGAGLTQLQMAHKLEVTPTTVYNWERGKYEPRATQLREIAQLFEVSMDDIDLVDFELEAKSAA